MAEHVNRREFLQGSMAAAAGAAIGMGLAQPSSAAEQPSQGRADAGIGAKGMPMGRIKD
ncbi:MAG: twin-arginine translocation signal domain-containing protein, partial [Planctomycetaceae bacterium]